MKIAVTYDNGEIFQHFGKTEHFKIYQMEEKKITSTEVIDTKGSGHGALAEFLKGLGADAVICGGIGEGARTSLSKAGIRLYPGVTGAADPAVEALLDGSLVYDLEVRCSHHGKDGH
ncbi:NifB/NifX family molybdenum-iron cluster-binding protein [Lacrimispora sp.]|uniref:NifB/NifX family molybdenum-iron cluster-binding protein n=1 Tax=Lacrimispora sp. TaxID=2719234 RepID=UPI0028B10297|nr:NifB/NifX family molybdenum-iron cluster-binding protein [Lacrimispora sp.]